MLGKYWLLICWHANSSTRSEELNENHWMVNIFMMILQSDSTKINPCQSSALDNCTVWEGHIPKDLGKYIKCIVFGQVNQICNWICVVGFCVKI